MSTYLLISKIAQKSTSLGENLLKLVEIHLFGEISTDYSRSGGYVNRNDRGKVEVGSRTTVSFSTANLTTLKNTG